MIQFAAFFFSKILLILMGSFRGKNFVIKYEGSFKYGNSDCFILEYVEHDRPEVIGAPWIMYSSFFFLIFLLS